MLSKRPTVPGKSLRRIRLHMSFQVNAASDTLLATLLRSIDRWIRLSSGELRGNGFALHQGTNIYFHVSSLPEVHLCPTIQDSSQLCIEFCCIFQAQLFA